MLRIGDSKVFEGSDGVGRAGKMKLKIAGFHPRLIFNGQFHHF